MKFLPDSQVTQLSAGLARNLAMYRHSRNFDPETYVSKKIDLLNDYFRAYDIQACVLGVSGGIDSAVVFELLTQSNVKVYPYIITSDKYTTHQREALNKVKEHSHKLDTFYHHIDISNQVRSLDQKIAISLALSTSDWALGQLVSNLRTTYLHHVATLLNDQVGRTVVMGTCNLDEGGYLGYIGKMSDGLVDIQPIADIHKSEVYALSQYFEIPESIIKATPSGDMFDNRNDLDVMGASYDFVELLRFYKNDTETFTRSLQPTDFIIWHEALQNLEKLHQFNSHKYEITLPSVFLDVMESHVKGGWNNTSWRKS